MTIGCASAAIPLLAALTRSVPARHRPAPARRGDRVLSFVQFAGPDQPALLPCRQRALCLGYLEARAEGADIAAVVPRSNRPVASPGRAQASLLASLRRH